MAKEKKMKNHHSKGTNWYVVQILLSPDKHKGPFSTYFHGGFM